MPPDILRRFRSLIHRPFGMILVTGPTGSGKTTTLYGALTELNKPEVKVITAEDPVEYRLPRITQVQVNSRIGLDFASVLRSRPAPGPGYHSGGEMRDQETVEIGLRAAMTGHLVLSTLHTNDAISSAMRLLDMGAEPFLVASSISGVLAQRLVRKVCDNCKAPYAPTDRSRHGWTASGACPEATVPSVRVSHLNHPRRLERQAALLRGAVAINVAIRVISGGSVSMNSWRWTTTCLMRSGARITRLLSVQPGPVPATRAWIVAPCAMRNRALPRSKKWRACRPRSAAASATTGARCSRAL